MVTRKKSDNYLTDVVKKIVTTGIGAAFMTEESVRSLLGDISLPKDILNGLIANAKKTKEDFLLSLQEEVKRYLAKVDIVKLVGEVIQNYDVEINATVRLRPKEKEKKTHVKK